MTLKILLLAILLVPAGMNGVTAQTIPGGSDEIEPIQTYTLEEIEHSFGVMETYVIYDENKNITFDIIDAVEDYDVSQLDIDIANDFAVHNNDIMTAATSGSTGQVDEFETNRDALDQALYEFENGKFKSLFETQSDSVNKVNEITFTTFNYVTPIVSAFGVSEYPIHTIHHSNSNSNLVCGGNYQNPHPADSTPTTISGFSALYAAQYNLYQNGYHMVPSYATFSDESSRPYDFASVVTSGSPGNCNDGSFRDQAIISSYSYNYIITENEPNPEVLGYSWPSFWWGPYVHWWHDNF